MNMNVCVIIPTCNGGDIWRNCASSLAVLKDIVTAIIVIDSESTDSTRESAEKYGFDVIGIKRREFNHGGTRNKAARYAIEHYNADILMFLTQDAILQTPEHAVNSILNAFECNDSLAALYGRQLPHDDANAIAKHARSNNYPSDGYCVSKINCHEKGLKAVFLSNSFSAYRASFFTKSRGFPENTILCEDMYYAALSLNAGYQLQYLPSVSVKHSHNYSPVEEFKRYFDIGVFHATETWIANEFGSATGEGRKFLISEFRYLVATNPLLIPMACLNNFMKIIGYKLGKNFRRLPHRLCLRLTMHKAYWK